jgi:NAD(P)H-hydrate epimerase
MIGRINASGVPVISVDIPSGLDADTGKILGSCVKARKTVTFIAGKRGMRREQGPQKCGEIVVDTLGVPLSAL